VALLPQITPRALVRRDLERQIGQLAGLAGDVAAAAASAGRPDRAVELLEQTRGLLVAEALQARGGDLAKLRSAVGGAALASAFEEQQRRIDVFNWASQDAWRRAPVHPAARLYEPGSWQAAESLNKARRQAHQAWERLTAQIRGSGFPDFLCAPGADELAEQGREGPVVFVYTSPAHCGTLALTANRSQPVRAIPLPNLSESEAYRQANRLRDALISGVSKAEASGPRSQLRAEREILDVLAWLWDTVTEPILTAVGYDATRHRARTGPGCGGARSASSPISRSMPRAGIPMPGPMTWRCAVTQERCWTGWSPRTFPRSAHRIRHRCRGLPPRPKRS